ncbi:MAG: hypothetical protein M1826_007494 [Phylliscum demangeonii]|nr:MAG: hypothetical protein M1826_007494 [Phylliscum demangeonii]
MVDAISIEETNRIRVAIGLKPLPVPGATVAANGPTFKAGKPSSHEGSAEDEPGSTIESRQNAAYDNWKALQDDAQAQTTRQAKNDAIKKARDAARRFAKLDGRGLGEAATTGGAAKAGANDELEEDTRTWLARQKKRQRKVEQARRLERELAERDAAATGDYTAKDLAGVKVGHELDAFEHGQEQILTLKDTTIEENDEEGDELENVDLREREARDQRLELKKRKPAYDPHAVEESAEKTAILGQYDEEIDGKKRKRFTLDGGRGMTVEQRAAMKEEASGKLKAKPISLEPAKAEPTSDYLEIKIRKPKKKAKSTRQKAVDEDDIVPLPDPVLSPAPNGNPDENPITLDATENPRPQKRALDDIYVDDEDLQASLAKQRRSVLKKRKKTGPLELARQIREEEAALGVDAAMADAADEMEGGMIIDETSEFVANLQKPTAVRRPGPSRSKATPGTAATLDSPPPAKADADGDANMSTSHPHAPSPEDEDDDDEDGEDDKKRIPRQASNAVAGEVTSTGLDDEATLQTGIGSTLNMLTQRGLLGASSTTESGDRNALHRERQRFLAEKHRRETEAEQRARLQRERDRASGRLDRMTAREKEAYAQAENKHRDQYESRQMADIFNREYKPDIEIKYTDEFGRQLNQKEAFKHLSHQFHGKGSGKQKTEKLLKKIEDEKRMEAKSVLDGSRLGSGLGGALGVVSKASKAPGVRLQ